MAIAFEAALYITIRILMRNEIGGIIWRIRIMVVSMCNGHDDKGDRYKD
jgi:hypothetical protein